MSWGEICALYGTTWAAMLAEVDALIGNLDPPSSLFQDEERSIWNNPPLTPAITPTPYVPGGPLSPAAPGGNC